MPYETSEHTLSQSTVHLSSFLILILTKKSLSLKLVSLKFKGLKQKRKELVRLFPYAVVEGLKKV